MNSWIALVIGLILGWGIELLIDFFYWRKRRLCPDDDVQVTQVELNKMKTANANLTQSLTSQDARIASLNAELEESKAAVATLQDEHSGRLNELEATGAKLNKCQENGGQLAAQLDELQQTLSARDARIKDLEGQLASPTAGAASTNAKAEAEIASLKEQLAICNASLMEMHANLSSGATGASGLSMIWGLNGAASEKLADNGIYTYNQLAAASPDQVGGATDLAARYYPGLDGAGIYDSWVAQAQYAAAGDWNGLSDYQSRFDPQSMKEDLKKLWGIGPKVEEVLNEHGIYLYAQIASIPAYRITQILRAAGSRFRMSAEKLHETWPQQARLADRGDWDGLAQATADLDWSQLHD